MAMGGNIFTWYAGEWKRGNTAIMGAADHGAWQGTMVFDGARAFDGLMPDLDQHSARIVRSATTMGMAAPLDGSQIEALIREGVAAMNSDVPLYLRPMIWSRECLPSLIEPDPAATEIAICIEELPMNRPGNVALTVSPFKRPHPDTAPTTAKAACLYPNNARIITEARSRGFNNALSMDLDGHVAETGSTNVFMRRDGEYFTPKPNGTFLNGITRQRIIGLLRGAGEVVHEASLLPEDFAQAEEIFLTGNASKVTPVSRFESRDLPTKHGFGIRDMYMDFAATTGRG
ncbi:MAG: branched-chain amino acid aminotransferase [Paracoccaceae bacterium]